MTVLLAAFSVRDSFFPLASTAEFNVAGFAGATGAVLLLLLLHARASGSTITESSADPDGSRDGTDETQNDPEQTRKGLHEMLGETDEIDSPDDASAASVRTNGDSPARGPASDLESARPAGASDESARRAPDESHPDSSKSPAADASQPPAAEMTTGALLANVAFSHGMFAVVLVGAAVVTAVPATALGVGVPTVATVGIGVGLGVALYLASELGAALSEWAGLGRDESLREMLAPESTDGWALLLFGVLPIIAGFEELLFRGALIGALSVGFGVSPWVLVVLSSVVFGLAHGVQGTAGMIVTGLLGFVLAAAFVLTGSLVVVIVAHYLVNALEFLIHEGLEIEWLDAGEG